jgi:uncharacterized protein (UPF0332 family)
MTDDERHDMVTYRLQRAKETIAEVNLHVENELWTTAVNRIYYACFYAASGLLLKYNINAQTHGGARQMLGLHFLKTGLISQELGNSYSRIFDMRNSGDYNDFVEFTETEVILNIPPASDLIKKIEELVK